MRVTMPRICKRRGILFQISSLLFLTWKEYIYRQPTNFYSQPTKWGNEQSSSPFTKPWTVPAAYRTLIITVRNPHCLGWLLTINPTHSYFILSDEEFPDPINFNANFWLGGTDLGHEGTWIWISSMQPVEDFVWYKDALGEPHESVNDNCMAWYRNRGFDKARNYPCSDSHYPLCQILV